MPRITESTRLEKVEYILGSVNGLFDFAVEGEDSLLTWEGVEDAEWVIEDTSVVKRDSEDRFIIYPEGQFFICDIPADGETGNCGPIRCWCE